MQERLKYDNESWTASELSLPMMQVERELMAQDDAHVIEMSSIAHQVRHFGLGNSFASLCPALNSCSAHI